MTAEILPEKPAYRPGEIIQGTVRWTADAPPRKAELRLFWFTRGKGDRDAETVGVVGFEMPQASDRREFSFPAPDGPPGFSGKLISLIWGLELVLEAGGSVLTELVIGPEGCELAIERPEWLQGEDPLKASS